MSIKSFLKSLFLQNDPYVLGALESPHDERNIDIASFQTPVSIPIEYETIMPPVEDQGSRYICVGEAISKIAELYFANKGIVVDLSPDDLYNQCKLVDGLPDRNGTFPAVAAKIACNTGIATEEAYQTSFQPIINVSRSKYRLGGYAFVSNDFDAVCQAIYQNGAISASVLIDSNWFNGCIIRVLKGLGRHYVIFNGYDYESLDGKIIKGQNSWSIKWIGYIAAIFNKRVRPGHFEVRWDDIKDTVVDMIVFADVPKELIDEAKGIPYQFKTTIRLGSRGYEVIQLQKMVGVFPIDGIFGNDTEHALADWQLSHSLRPDGIFGPACRAIANKRL